MLTGYGLNDLASITQSAMSGPVGVREQDTDVYTRQSSSREEFRLHQTIAAYNADAVGYTQRFNDVDLKEHRGRLINRCRAISGPVLDAGCGPGRDLQRFAEDGVRAVGLDLSIELLRIAREHGHSIIRADLRNIPVASGTFAGVWACASLLHLTADGIRAALSEFHRVLKPGGGIFISVRHGSGIEERLHSDGSTRWFYFYSAATMERLLLESGFIDIEVTVDPGVAHGTWVNVHARS